MAEHGTTTRYNRGCRCGLCVAAKSRAAAATRRRQGVPERPRMRHGTVTMYIHGRCRCGRCREARRAYYGREG